MKIKRSREDLLNQIESLYLRCDLFIKERDDARRETADVLLQKAQDAVAFRDEIFKLTRELKECQSRTR